MAEEILPLFEGFKDPDTRPLSGLNIQQILVELAEDINAALRKRGGFAQFVTFTADFIGQLTPLQLVDILKNYGLLSFVHLGDELATVNPLVDGGRGTSG
ncbi:hypothetical protein [Mycobacterium sp.]|uniref:hypothetical protein n=1 Tax=Mycobacterium sp. TaxID=1785 RepID=UPI002C3A8445|nr:hypothetical protein [Mycobacterium sp.]HME49022.1 hypothetical protein [Mycobacterium sp.]